ncbi:MAG: Tellurite resistance protein TerB [Myxococcales bacterium]|nr:Tellurite resistance protein TerB [Myxococcales bacterium]
MGAITFAPDEAQEIARALAAVAAADGAILAREASFLDAFAMAHSVGGLSFIPATLDVARLARVIAAPDKRREVLRLCVKMALSDGNYADGERRAIVNIATTFGVGADELQQLTEEVRTAK